MSAVIRKSGNLANVVAILFGLLAVVAASVLFGAGL